ncbi:MAG TPA: hypothetical protein VGO67_07185 [Verrucomicrobiae bacterium]|jgi:hypothetical protein
MPCTFEKIQGAFANLRKDDFKWLGTKGGDLGGECWKLSRMLSVGKECPLKTKGGKNLPTSHLMNTRGGGCGYLWAGRFVAPQSKSPAGDGTI